ncbi:Crp/Fnr family transcriptional regulator [Oscillibacter sp. MSJ-2]|uniref:Crp/Fnr family transcriptional regulator n=1 Tax=Dysosmobacter acutus TaxID=2841504 RepID=A0ABS6F9Q7_9FIRM|nr:Crp/Fnr family transcriptional regulator [Dysosmobacter acutus]MBU5627034.1 Crp/Fnr family transcriptional regulator [Dysosmobacter acutus]
MEKTAALQILFGRLPPLEGRFDQYLDQGKCLKIFQNERISFDREASQEPGVFYVQTGLLKLSVHRPLSATGLDFCYYGERTILERRTAASLSGCGRMYIEACENTIAYAFSQREFFELLGKDRALLEQYHQLYAAQLSLLFRRMELTACLDAEQRVVGWLIQLCRQSTPDGEGGCFIPCRLTQQEIADYLLIHVTTFNRVFSELKKESIVEKKRSGFLVHDVERLQRFEERLSI